MGSKARTTATVMMMMTMMMKLMMVMMRGKQNYKTAATKVFL